MLKRGPILGLIYRLVISLFIFRRKPTGRSSRGLCCEERNTRNKLFKLKTSFNFPKAKCIILLFFLLLFGEERFVVGKKGGVAATRKLSCGKARNFFLRHIQVFLTPP